VAAGAVVSLRPGSRPGERGPAATRRPLFSGHWPIPGLLSGPPGRCRRSPGRTRLASSGPGGRRRSWRQRGAPRPDLAGLVRAGGGRAIARVASSAAGSAVASRDRPRSGWPRSRM